MAHIYSVNFQDAQLDSPSGELPYFVPAGMTAVLRDIDVWSNAGVSAGELQLYTQGGTYPWLVFNPPNAGGPFQGIWRGRQVYTAPADEELAAWIWITPGGATNTWGIRCSGYLLS